MQRIYLVPLLLAGLFAVSACGQEEAVNENDAKIESDLKIKSALSAGPESLTKNATIQDWDGTVLRAGSNVWTCLPDIPDNGGNDPWCLDETWMKFFAAVENQTPPPTEKLGIGYLMAGAAPVSNTDPAATEKTDDNMWVGKTGAIMVMAVPDPELLAGFLTDPNTGPNSGGPWVMWAGTPYVHLMVPIDAFPPQ